MVSTQSSSKNFKTIYNLVLKVFNGWTKLWLGLSLLEENLQNELEENTPVWR